MFIPATQVEALLLRRRSTILLSSLLHNKEARLW